MATAAERNGNGSKAAAAAATAAASSAPAAGGAAGAGGELTTKAAIAAFVSSVVAALVAALMGRRRRLMDTLRARLVAGNVEAGEMERLVALEVAREDEFVRRSAQRVAAVAQRAAGLPVAEREAAMRDALVREERYASLRAEAVAARAFAAVERVQLRLGSPSGAFWRLDPTVVEHTKGCLLMGGRFWPWEVLNRVHPPRHAGCPCRLLGYQAAVAEGLMRPEDVVDVRTAVRSAARVVMEAAEELPADDVRLMLEMGRVAEEEALLEAAAAAGLLKDGGGAGDGSEADVSGSA